MGVYTTQGYKFRLVAGTGSYENRTQLDLFADEEIKVSNNITDLFDIGAVPGTFTRTITLPGTKTNNAFFEQYYDISVVEPDIFSTNQKIEAYLDFEGIYLVSGYLQLTKVSVYENKFVDSYEINLFGIVSNFSVDAQRYFLTDLDSLGVYNHTSSLANISASWQGDLFSGSIRYALTDSGNGLFYSTNNDGFGLDDQEGGLNVQNFKPAIKAKLVWDAIFTKLGFTYTGSFFNEPILDNVYLIANNSFRYPTYPTSIDTYGEAKATSATGSFQNILLTNNVSSSLPFNSKTYDYNNVITLGNPAQFNSIKSSYYQARIDLNFAVSSSGAAGSGAPTFYVYFNNINTGAVSYVELRAINQDLINLYLSRPSTVSETLTKTQSFETPFLEQGTYNMSLMYTAMGVNNFTVKLNPSTSTVNTSFTNLITKQAADGNILDIPSNMPFGTNGIRLIDFIRGIQKKFNLIMYESKAVPNQFIVETFDTWYKQGDYKDFNRYINLNEKIEFIPANTLSVNKLNFTDIQDTDYVSTLWQRTYNRTFGEAILIDTGSYFSQGEFKVGSTLGSGPLGRVPNTIVTGSAASTSCTSYRFSWVGTSGSGSVTYTRCNSTPITVTLSPAIPYIVVCAATDQYTLSGYYMRATVEGDCSPIVTVSTGSQFPMYIPYYITNNEESPAARVMPRLMFWNGMLPTTPYYIKGYEPVTYTGSAVAYPYSDYPYFDNYSVVSGSILPSTSSYSLLYNNETPSLGTAPTEDLITTYWQTYLQLLYNPRTRLVNAAAVIPLADYFDMELNDLVQFRSNYYHLRAINDYNLTTGECAIQLLGPTIPDAVSSIVNFTPEPADGDFNCDWNDDFYRLLSCT